MSTNEPTEVSIEQRDGVVLTRMDDFPEDDGGDLERRWMRVAERPTVSGAVTVFGDVRLSAEVQNRIAEEWSDGATDLGIDRVAFVSDGVTAMAVKSNVEADAELETFETVADAVEWAA